MNLVGDDDAVVLAADLAEFGEFFLRPDAADRVVRVAKDDAANPGDRNREGGARFEEIFQIIEIHLIPFAVEFQVVRHDMATVVLNRTVERIVNGRLQDNLVAGHGQ